MPATPKTPLRKGTGIKRALSFSPPSKESLETLPTTSPSRTPTPPPTTDFNLPLVTETPEVRRQHTHAPNAPKRNPLRADPPPKSLPRAGGCEKRAAAVWPAGVSDEATDDVVFTRPLDRRLDRLAGINDFRMLKMP